MPPFPPGHSLSLPIPMTITINNFHAHYDLSKNSASQVLKSVKNSSKAPIRNVYLQPPQLKSL